MVNDRRQATFLTNGALVLGLIAIGSGVGFAADEPAAPATPQPPKTATAPRSRAVVTDQDGEPIEPFKPAKAETPQEKAHKEALSWFMSGRLKQAESRFSEALSDYQMAIKLDPNAVEVYRRLGAARVRLE